MKRTVFAATVCCMLLATMHGRAAEPWSTYRGNSQRTGNTDGKPGPLKGDVLWAHKGLEHFIASPVPFGDRLVVSGLSGFNQPTILGLHLAGKDIGKPAWTKSAPVFKLPTVSSPAVAGGKLVLGDGMHQTDGAILHCLNETGRPLWQLTVPGTLVHLEGAPTVADGKVYIGGGAGGVICVELNKVHLDGKELDVAAVEKLLDEKWKALQAKFEMEKKKDEFAVPPTEDQLPKPTPIRVWQQGEKKWHVDAPVAVAGNRVLVATAFLDKEKVGDRALVCLDAKDGKEMWRTPLAINPWGGPSVEGDTVVVGGSTVGYDPAQLKGAKGHVAAYDLNTGKEKWRKPAFPGGVLSSVALTSDLAICTATDGKVRAYKLATGEPLWRYEQATPFFAPPAVAGDLVYAADLQGTVHAIDLKGVLKWKLDLPSHPSVGSPGMVYAGPVVHGGKLYVATCNLTGPNTNRPTVVVCIGDK